MAKKKLSIELPAGLPELADLLSRLADKWPAQVTPGGYYTPSQPALVQLSEDGKRLEVWA